MEIFFYQIPVRPLGNQKTSHYFFLIRSSFGITPNRNAAFALAFTSFLRLRGPISMTTMAPTPRDNSHRPPLHGCQAIWFVLPKRIILKKSILRMSATLPRRTPWSLHQCRGFRHKAQPERPAQQASACGSTACTSYLFEFPTPPRYNYKSTCAIKCPRKVAQICWNRTKTCVYANSRADC